MRLVRGEKNIELIITITVAAVIMQMFFATQNEREKQKNYFNENISKWNWLQSRCQRALCACGVLG